MLIKFPYPSILPACINRHIILVDPNKSNTESILSCGNDVVLTMWIEGARNKLSYVRSGFVHIATSLDADLGLCYIDWKEFRYKKKVLPVGTYSHDTVLREFKEFIGDNRCAIYPGSCSELRFKNNSATYARV